ncbi:MAG: serine/threonine protein kinase with repeat [Candidatus Krumholzibacteriota bacterium]|nr:serine/threonine protein kinase with repeat [Candidatus Krumholzibacteriota bacterium]
MERISHFDLESLVSGFRGPVYLATDVSSGRSVHLLVLPRASIPSTIVERILIKDALDASKIDHPNVAKIYGIEEADGRILISYEAVAGETLAGRIGSIPVSEAVGIFRGILEGLDAAHAKGVVHGCLSAAEVMVSGGGVVKITGFGLEKLARNAIGIDGDPARLAYFSPEMLQRMEVDEAADLWSAGVILFAMLSGRAPFDAGDVPSLIYKILNTDPLSDEAIGKIPSDLRPVLARLLRKDPASRPSSARDALEMLEERSRAGRVEGRRVSVGVMYLDHVPTGDGKGHVAVGITEDLIYRLSCVKELAVTSRQDSLVLKGRDVDPQQVGRCMGLDVLVSGAVTFAGDAIRVEARAVDTTTGSSVWTGSLERPAREAFSIAPSLAAGLVEAMRVPADDAEMRIVETPITVDERAFDFYARGRDFLTRRGERNTGAAIWAFEYALACDRDLSHALEGLAAAYSAMYTYYDGAESWLDGMAGAAGKAVGMDPRLIEARLHLALASLHRKDYAAAKNALEKILKDRPEYYEAYRWLGILSDMTERYEDAVGYYRKAAEIKPCSVEPWLLMNMTHRRRGDLAAATEAARRFLEVGLRVLHVVPDDPVTLSRFCPIYTLFGEADRARDTLDRILRTGTEDGLVLYNCAATYALLRDPENSFACLRKALSAGYQNVREWIEGDPDFANIRETETFRALLSEFDLRHTARADER